jgi:hypothetical protein
MCKENKKLMTGVVAALPDISRRTVGKPDVAAWVPHPAKYSVKYYCTLQNIIPLCTKY